MTINRWFELAEKFYDRISKYGEKIKLGDIVRELFPFAKENKLDVFDIEAITGILFGEDASKVITSIYLKKQISKEV